MKKLLKIITPLIVIILFTILYVNDNECSLIGAICMACVIGGLFFLPIPYSWGKVGYVALGGILCIIFTLFLLFEKNLSFSPSLLYAIPVAIVICIVQYLIQRTIQKFLQKQ